MKWLSLVIVFALLNNCVPITQPTSSSQKAVKKKLVFQDFRYEPNILSDILYPNRGFIQDVVQSSAIALGGETRLILEFDELYTDYQDYNVKLVHCNADWTKSTLPDLEFITDYNEYPIRTYDYSQSTLIPYTHYTFEVPQVRLPGNYLLVVYRGANKDDLILSRKFVVFDSKVQISPKIAVMTGATGRFQNHQIEFEINYQGLKLTNPYNDIKVIIRQNQRWDNAIKGLTPTQVRQDRSTLVYRHFTGKNAFPSLNEFRLADLRSTTFKGQNVTNIEKGTERITAHLRINRSRANDIYSQYSDLNGSYVIENNDPGADYLEEDYITTYFYLDHPQQTKPIYVIGAFNNWQKVNRMTFNQDRKLYITSLKLKQGFYNYVYYMENGDPHPYSLEGAFYEAENDYDIIVYYRDPKTFSDLAVGYVSFNSRN